MIYKITLILAIFFAGYFYCQDIIKTDVPHIIPPSPTTSALMKFEEIPVSNYTGVPEVKIPLFNIGTSSKEKKVDISLNYHPAGIAVDEIASDVGLGWSLMFGGTVSRVIKGHPDEILQQAGGTTPNDPAEGKLGVYQTSTQNNINPFYEFSNRVLNDYKNYQKPNLNLQDTELGNEFIWTAGRRNRYDTEHDLWQFNFWGNTGRFFIKKNITNNLLQVIPLDNNNLKIVNQYNSSTFVPTGFIIYDEYGFQYIFDIIEVSKNSGGVKTTTYVPDGNGGVQLFTDSNIFEEPEFNSSFHLSKIIDNNNKEIVTYKYSNISAKESFTKINRTVAEGIPMEKYRDSNKCQDLPPLETIYRSSTLVNTKKIDSIYITDIAKIHFKFQQGREDDNLDLPNQSSFLESVSLYDWHTKLQKKYSFSYNYKKVINKRMILTDIKEYDRQNNFIGKHELFYKPAYNADQGRIGKDKWGYFNLTSICQNVSADELRQVTPTFSSTDILQKIKYPTGGSVLFDYEANQFSYIGNQNIQGQFAYNFLNTLSATLYAGNNTFLIPDHYKNRKMIIYPGIVDAPGINRTFWLEKFNGSQWEGVANLYCLAQNPTCCIEVLIDKNYSYRITRHNFNIPDNDADGFSISVFEEAGTTLSQFGGGNRIKRIGYFKNDVATDHYDQGLIPPHHQGNNPLAKEVLYSYNEIGNSEKSSGSLVNKIPEFEYYHSFTTKFYFGAYSNGAFCRGTLNTNMSDGALLRTLENNFKFFQTKGGDVGYKNVTVEEVDNGKTVYTYSSAFDYPADNSIAGPPFVKPKDYDYKRGLLYKSEVYSNTGQKLSETNNTYSFEENEEYLGVRFVPPSDIYNGKSGDYPTTFAAYKSLLNIGGCMKCDDSYFIQKSFLGGLPLDINTSNFLIVPVFETYGWVKLNTKQDKNFFYESGQQKMIEKNEFFEYNPLNKKISQKTSVSNGEELKTKYFYHSGNSGYTQNRISEIERIENYKNGKLIDTKKIVYDNHWGANAAYLPKEVQSSFGAGSLETDITYDKYDDKSNILQYTTKGGITTTIIWGYNKSYPIAKLENVGLRYIFEPPPELELLINQAIAASDVEGAAMPNVDESTFLLALDNLRASPYLQDAYITTYTYDPVIGIRSIKHPSGIMEFYLYDSANRLKEIRQDGINGKILKEFKYNYKN